MKVLVVLAAAVLLTSCSKAENEGVGLIQEVAAEVKTKPHVQLSVKMAGDQPTPEEEALLRSLETQIDGARIGRLVSSGFEPGYMTIRVEVENTADAISKLRTILQTAGVLRAASFKVIER